MKAILCVGCKYDHTHTNEQVLMLNSVSWRCVSDKRHKQQSNPDVTWPGTRSRNVKIESHNISYELNTSHLDAFTGRHAQAAVVSGIQDPQFLDPEMWGRKNVNERNSFSKFVIWEQVKQHINHIRLYLYT